MATSYRVRRTSFHSSAYQNTVLLMWQSFLKYTYILVGCASENNEKYSLVYYEAIGKSLNIVQQTLPGTPHFNQCTTPDIWPSQQAYESKAAQMKLNNDFYDIMRRKSISYTYSSIFLSRPLLFTCRYDEFLVKRTVASALIFKIT